MATIKYHSLETLCQIFIHITQKQLKPKYIICLNSGTYTLSHLKLHFKLNFKATLDAIKLVFLLVFVPGAIKVSILMGYHSFHLNCMLIHL